MGGIRNIKTANNNTNNKNKTVNSGDVDIKVEIVKVITHFYLNIWNYSNGKFKSILRCHISLKLILWIMMSLAVLCPPLFFQRHYCSITFMNFYAVIL